MRSPTKLIYVGITLACYLQLNTSCIAEEQKTFNTPSEQNFSASLGAYLQFDNVSHNDDRSDLRDDAKIRRARLSVSGAVHSEWDYKFEADFAASMQDGNRDSNHVTEAWISYRGFEPISVTIGYFKIPFSLESINSAKSLIFMERSLPYAFLLQKRLGGMITAHGTNWTTSLGLFTEDVTSQSDDNEANTISARATYAPIAQQQQLIHLGFSAARIDPRRTSASTNDRTVRFSARPESNSTERFVDTDDISGDIHHYYLFGGEFATVHGPFSLQGEYTHTSLEREIGAQLHFNGYYLYGSYFLTGEARNYKIKKGSFESIQPHKPFTLPGNGLGAWEVTLRFSNLDLNHQEVSGGEIDDVTFGVNWYPNSHLRFTANYVDVLRVSGGDHDKDTPSLLQLRMQLMY